MDAAAGDPERRFEQLASRFISRPDVTQGTGFGSSPGLRVRGKIFAMLVGGGLVVKLPKDRVDELVATGVAARFDSGRGRVMKEWATVPIGRVADWERLAVEAFAFVNG